MSMAIKYGLQKKAKAAAMPECIGDDCEGCATCMPEPAKMAEGGEVGGDLVDRIMKKRKGPADNDSADFDAMDQMTVPDDANYTGANSGDELGNDAMDENDRDLIARIMRSRAKRDRMPRPA